MTTFPRFLVYRWEQNEAPPLLLLAGFAREQEERRGATNPSDPPLKRWVIHARPAGTIGLRSSNANCIRLNSYSLRIRLEEPAASRSRADNSVGVAAGASPAVATRLAGPGRGGRRFALTGILPYGRAVGSGDWHPERVLVTDGWFGPIFGVPPADDRGS